ncbi:hypothetical protein BIW11_04325 [Tropilaelaps mercedesae]|uniref:Uncharacterized protein n=1 Tax=Tropilaelaps mercedesae TaxID=418985 RepID=A0A1V9X7X5_9ACAR|nr:hypothetical protein BIW11_04325 [Tropilaelaps mercedesae]
MRRDGPARRSTTEPNRSPTGADEDDEEEEAPGLFAGRVDATSAEVVKTTPSGGRDGQISESLTLPRRARKTRRATTNPGVEGAVKPRLLERALIGLANTQTKPSRNNKVDAELAVIGGRSAKRRLR